MTWLASLAAAALGLCAPPAHAASDLRQVPYWASLKANEVYMRVGPGEDYRINWIYHRQHLPLKVLRIMQNWRLVQDPQGTQGWIIANMLAIGHDGFVVGQAPAEMHEAAASTSRLLWRLEPGVLGKIGDCTSGWCRFTVNGRAGYVVQDALWGAAELTGMR
ncbi:MAG: SH3 domain-containing protein [Pseudomonadota bacterium]|nr:SH3 domain-containing protein [Pseudomonadota bacterium]